VMTNTKIKIKILKKTHIAVKSICINN